MKIIVGLGNPGKQYQLTRHNIGYRVVETFLQKSVESDIRWKSRFNSHIFSIQIKNEPIIIVKPLTYMNLSGIAVNEVLNFYRGNKNDLLVIYDDIHLPLGTLRIRHRGSSGGHRGMESIIQSLETQEFPRLRVGIFNQILLKQMDHPSFVLSKFLPEEERILEKIIPQAAQAIHDILEYGYDYAMRQHNKNEVQSDQKPGDQS